MIEKNISQLEEILCYKFQSRDMVAIAITHPSCNATSPAKSATYQRLEFLGDKVIGLIAADRLYHLLEDCHQGKLSIAQNSLTSGKALSHLATRLRLGELIIFGLSEVKTGGMYKSRNLEDVFEAIIGAIFLDSSFVQTQEILVRLWDQSVDYRELVTGEQNYKTRLQELVQKDRKNTDTISYRLIGKVGMSHDTNFEISLSITGIDFIAKSIAKSKKEAEQQAAKKMLEFLGKMNDRG